ncbi:MAG: hypothetical protein EOM26_04540 [Alphaproteobacteria bacterium]|nr:hypothetical protein [Alphaproteobacteria bacterium]
MTRLDAARKQLVTAVNLHLLDVEPVAVHVLANNALTLLKQELAGNGQRSLSEFAGSHPALFGAEQKDARIFLAGQGDEDAGDIEDKDNDVLLFFACADYQSAAGKTELEFQIYGQWFLAVNAEYARDAHFEQFPESIRAQFLPPEMPDQPRVMQKQTGHALIVHMHDEMDKAATGQCRKGD